VEVRPAYNGKGARTPGCMRSPQVFEKFVRTLKSHRLLRRGDRLLIAVSGGADSVALLYLMQEVRAQFELDLVIAHLNHNLRGKSSDDDEQFVRVLAKDLGIKFVSKKIPDEAVASRNQNLEAWARERRYAFLSEAAARVQAQEVALGHTMNDQAETLLMRLLRGSGSAGLSCMPFKRDLFIRPLLAIQRHEVLAYLKLRGIKWREDLSNFDTRLFRNKIRQELIPNLRDRQNPKIVSQLACTAAVLREESEALQHWAAEVLRKEAVIEGNKIFWNVDTLGSLPTGLQKRLVRLSLERLMEGNHFLSAKNIDSVIYLLGEGRSGRLVRIGTCRSVREFGRLVFEVVPDSRPCEFRYALPIPGRVELPLTHTWFEARLDCRPADSTVLNRWELFLSKAELTAGMLIRNWQPADVYFAPGVASPKRVTDLFAQKKIPRRCRASWPVVVLNGRVVCVKDFPFLGGIPVQAGEKTRVVVEERSEA